MRKFLYLLVLTFPFLITPIPLQAFQEASETDKKKPAEPEPDPEPAVTHHQIQVP